MTTYLGEQPTLKDPDATLDYPLDWGDWLTAAGDGTDELQAVDVAVFLEDGVTAPPADTPLTVVEGSAQVSAGDGDVVRYSLVNLSGGVAGTVYAVRYRVTTVQGRVDDRTRYVKIRQR